jgi:hypothetical protein
MKKLILNIVLILYISSCSLNLVPRNCKKVRVEKHPFMLFFLHDMNVYECTDGSIIKVAKSLDGHKEIME